MVIGVVARMRGVNLCKEPGAAGPVARATDCAHERPGVCRSHRCLRTAARTHQDPGADGRGRARQTGLPSTDAAACVD